MDIGQYRFSELHNKSNHCQISVFVVLLHTFARGFTELSLFLKNYELKNNFSIELGLKPF